LLSSPLCTTARNMAQTVVATWIPRLRNNQIWRITAEQRQHSKCYKNIGTTANILLIWIVVIRNLVHRFCWPVLLQSCFCFRWRNPLTVDFWHMFIVIAQPDTESWISPNYITCLKYRVCIPCNAPRSMHFHGHNYPYYTMNSMKIHKNILLSPDPARDELVCK